jgi:hypothetical protein
MSDDVGLPSAFPIDWNVYKKGSERILLGTVHTRHFFDAREMACQQFGLDRGDLEIVAAVTNGKASAPKVQDAHVSLEKQLREEQELLAKAKQRTPRKKR